jgi:hypothetical protein
MLAPGLVIWLALANNLAECAPDRLTAEARSVAFLAREVPRWARENRCYSCHNNGDAARALYEAARAGHLVAREALADTTGWLLRPADWDRNGGDGPFNDKRLARISFTAALATALATEWTLDRSVLARAADRLAVDQASDGSWTTEGQDSAGSPAAYGSLLATFLARQSLFAAQEPRLKTAIKRADAWLLSREVNTMTDASVSLLVQASVQSPTAGAQRQRSLDLLERGQSEDGGWGPNAVSPAEPFDTALALLGLARCQASPKVRGMIGRGRAFLIAQQNEDGSWTETTRPPGNVSYAQRISTTGWVTLALLDTLQKSAPLPSNAKRNGAGLGRHPSRDRASQIDLERPGHTIPRQIFQVSSNHEAIGSRMPGIARRESPGCFSALDRDGSRESFLRRTAHGDQAIKQRTVQWLGESDNEGLLRILAR